jgi:hypothetical protein
MKKGIKISLILLVVALMFGVSSCTKKPGADTPFTRIQGRWKKVRYATDDNRNGVIDVSEVSPVAEGVDNEITFRGDSTGMETNAGSPALNFRWRITDGASVLVSYNANDTITYTIAYVTSNNLTLNTVTNLGLTAYYYNRY